MDGSSSAPPGLQAGAGFRRTKPSPAPAGVPGWGVPGIPGWACRCRAIRAFKAEAEVARTRLEGIPPYRI